MIDHKQLLLEKLRSAENRYNPELKLLRVPFNSPGYHTTLKNLEFVYATYPNLVYAVALLDSELPEYETRAFEIIETVVSLQDTDRSRETFGIWPWYFEEPLEQMSPPDWNWADFCGKELVLAVSRHERRFPASLSAKVKQAIFNACEAIIKRNAGPHYTNIAIMGSFVTLLTGELYQRDDYKEYGLQRLEKALEFTRRLGTFQEYNSPTYAAVTILELSRIRTATGLERAKEIAEQLLDAAWSMAAEHFHPATMQWSGPHSRCYRTLLKEEIQSFLQIATGGSIVYYPNDQIKYQTEWYKSGIECPRKYVSFFVTPEQRTIRQLYHRDETKKAEKWATTYMTRDYVLGTFSKEIMWNQCRNLLAYVNNGGQSTYVHLRCLNDGYDYCSAIFRSVQVEGQVLFGIHFATDGGNTHPNLDPANGKIVTSDFRLRFEIGGNQENIVIDKRQSSMDVRVSGVRIMIEELYSVLDDMTDFDWEISRGDQITCVDLIVYSGQPTTFDFHQMAKASFVMAFGISGKEMDLDAEVSLQKDFVSSKLSTLDGGELRLVSPTKPGTLNELFKSLN